ncbi:hypothetical protein B0H13DRAFT_1880582 [Mycena leptocephala]|nr:hypothetical protein B0H13DRAFT_1880582 [Mycena leptocephala]
MEDTTISSLDRERASDNQGIVASTSPNNEAVITTSAEDKASQYFNMAHDSFLEYKAAGNISSLNTAIHLLECAASSWPPGDTEFSDCLNHLATALLIRFKYTMQYSKDIQDACVLHSGALGYPIQDFLQSMVQDGHEDVTSKDMMTSAVMMLKEFLQAHNQETLETSILLYQEGLKLTAETHFPQWRILWELSDALLIQFHHTGNLEQVHEAISCLRQVQKAKANHSVCLLAALISGHENTVVRLHQAEAARLAEEMVENDQKALDLIKLGEYSLELFEIHHDSIHLEEGVRNWQEAELLSSWGHRSRGTLLNDLACAVQTRYEQQGDSEDIDEALSLLREALEIHAARHPCRAMSLNNLANAVQTQFEQCGDPKDIDEAITLHREALEIRAVPHPNRGSSLNNLATAVRTRFEQWGDHKDIDEAITLCREALEIHAAPHPLRGSSLNNMAAAVRTRYTQQGDPKDIDEAIVLCREALEICAARHPDRGMSLNNLATAVKTRYAQWGDPKDIDEAITLHREALGIHAAPHPLWGSSLTNLGNAVGTRFEKWGDPKDIDEAITLHREALEIHAEIHAPHPDQGICLNNLAAAVENRFQQGGEYKDIDEAITLFREALEIHAAPHPDRGMSLNNLATALRTRFGQWGDAKDIDEAITLHREASIYTYSSPLTRFSASHNWITSATKNGHESLVEAYRVAIKLLPQLAAFSLDLKSRQQMLARTDIASLASASATCAISLNEPDIAVEFLEASRSIFWAQALQLRTPVDKLEHIKPELSTKLRHLSQQLEQASFRDISQNISMNTQRHLRSMEAVAAQCCKLNEEWDETVKAVRKVPGFGDSSDLKALLPSVRLQHLGQSSYCLPVA